MPDVAPSLVAGSDAGHVAIAERLGRAVAILGGRVADLLGRLPMPPKEAFAEGRAFLESMAKPALSGRSGADEPLCALEQGPDGIEHPIDRLVHVLGLTPCEVDLILLAAMADEHEGYASVLRT